MSQLGDKELMLLATKHGKKIGRKEAIEVVVESIKQRIEDFQPLEIYVIGDSFAELFLRSDVQNAIQQHKEHVGQYLDKFGLPDKYHILHLHSDAGVSDVVSVFRELYGDLESKLKLKSSEESVVLVENDEVVEKYQKELETEAGIKFILDWQLPQSDYRRLVKAAKTYGTCYEMVKKRQGWTYTKIKKK